jgi:hypothetical protein
MKRLLRSLVEAFLSAAEVFAPPRLVETARLIADDTLVVTGVELSHKSSRRGRSV